MNHMLSEFLEIRELMLEICKNIVKQTKAEDQSLCEQTISILSSSFCLLTKIVAKAQVSNFPDKEKLLITVDDLYFRLTHFAFFMKCYHAASSINLKEAYIELASLGLGENHDPNGR